MIRRRVRSIRHVFVVEVPRQIDEKTLYISMDDGTCIHRCLCGCGAEVVTPLSPRQWSLTYDGETVSLWPSIGSWNLPCQSHYIISHNRVRWARRFSPEEIDEVQRRHRPDSTTEASGPATHAGLVQGRLEALRFSRRKHRNQK